MMNQALAIVVLVGLCSAVTFEDEAQLHESPLSSEELEDVFFTFFEDTENEEDSDESREVDTWGEDLGLTNLFIPHERVIKLNKGVDKVLGFITEEFYSIGELGIPLPDISKSFGHPPYSGTFSATKGHFRNPATLHRTGDVEVMVSSDTTVQLGVHLGLKVAEVGFDEYHLDVLNAHHKGTIKVSVDKNSLSMRLILTYAPACTFTLDELRFDELSGLEVDITGLGVFQLLFNELSTWLISNFESNFRDIINKQLYDKANKALAKKDICKYFPQ